MRIAIKIPRKVERMLEAIEARWNREHGPRIENPLLAEFEHTIDLLRVTPEIGIVQRRRSRGTITERR